MKYKKNAHQKLCKSIVDLFADKHKMDIEFAVVDDWGGVICLGDYYFTFVDIVIDITKHCPKNLIFDWYQEMLTKHTKGKKSMSYEKYVDNYFKHLKLEIKK